MFKPEKPQNEALVHCCSASHLRERAWQIQGLHPFSLGHWYGNPGFCLCISSLILSILATMTSARAFQLDFLPPSRDTYHKASEGGAGENNQFSMILADFVLSSTNVNVCTSLLLQSVKRASKTPWAVYEI